MKDMNFIRDIPEEEKTPPVISLLEAIQYLIDRNRQLEDEIAGLKDHGGLPRNGNL